LENNVLLPGIVPDDDLPVLLSGAKVFVYVSSFEGFGLPVLEAMACGTPTITSNVTSLPEVAGNAALMVKPGDVEELTQALRQVLNDPLLHRQMSERGLEQARQFTWERAARATLAVYQNAVRSH
jgi:glycosyltransferase involved in cell wall biosynthesis